MGFGLRRPLLPVVGAILALTYGVLGDLDDWGLVDKYCPIKDTDMQIVPPRPEIGHKFYIYRDHPAFEAAITRVFRSALGGFGRSRKHHLESDSEFFGEVEVFCELIKHPDRTWDPDEAKLFVVPAFPTLAQDTTMAVAKQLERELPWRKHRGRDHLVLCTHWACGARLGPLFQSVAEPGWIATLERNVKWLDPRLYRVDIDQGWARTGPQLLTSQDHVLCPERTVVLPYPPHPGILECRHRRVSRALGFTSVWDIDRQHPVEPSALLPLPPPRTIAVFFAGALRHKLCGLDTGGNEVHKEPSHGVRPALTLRSLEEKYVVRPSFSSLSSSEREERGEEKRLRGEEDHGGKLREADRIREEDDEGKQKESQSRRALSSSSSTPTPAIRSSNPLNAFRSVQELEASLKRRRYHLQMLASGAHGGKRQESATGGSESGSRNKKLSYPTLIRTSHLCLHLRGDTPTSRRLYDSIAAGCLPIVVSDNLGAALPFVIGREVNYSAWLTVIPEAQFTRDPLGSIDAVVEDLLCWTHAEPEPSPDMVVLETEGIIPVKKAVGKPRANVQPSSTSSHDSNRDGSSSSYDSNRRRSRSASMCCSSCSNQAARESLEAGMLPGIGPGHWTLTDKALEMRRAMARDTHKLILCSAHAAVGDQLLRELFLRIHLRDQAANASGIAVPTFSLDRDEQPDYQQLSKQHHQCLPSNEKSLRPLYASAVDTHRPSPFSSSSSSSSSPLGLRAATTRTTVEGAVATPAEWVAASESRLGTNWTWCVEETSQFRDYDYDSFAAERRERSFNNNSGDTIWPSALLLPPALPVDTLVHVA